MGDDEWRVVWEKRRAYSSSQGNVGIIGDSYFAAMSTQCDGRGDTEITKSNWQNPRTSSQNKLAQTFASSYDDHSYDGAADDTHALVAEPPSVVDRLAGFMDHLVVLGGTSGSNSPPNFGAAAVSDTTIAPLTAQGLIGAATALNVTLLCDACNARGFEPVKNPPSTFCLTRKDNVKSASLEWDYEQPLALFSTNAGADKNDASRADFTVKFGRLLMFSDGTRRYYEGNEGGTVHDALDEHACSVLGATICNVYHNVYALKPQASKRQRDCDEGFGERAGKANRKTRLTPTGKDDEEPNNSKFHQYTAQSPPDPREANKLLVSTVLGAL